jgi:micrococcal nuclease
MKPSAFCISVVICWFMLWMVSCDGAASQKEGDSIKGRVVGVHDGDSITVLTHAQQQIKVRLEGIDAPELRQAFGQKAKVTLSGMVMSRQITLQQIGTDRYKRTLAVVYVEGRNVNLEMVRLGYAWHYVQYSDDAQLAKAEREARQLKRGLWTDPSPVPPWSWRRK